MSTRLDDLVRLLSEPGTSQMTRAELAAHLGDDAEFMVFEIEPLDPETGLGDQVLVPLEAIEGWEAGAAANHNITSWPTTRADVCGGVIEEVLGHAAESMGRAAIGELRATLMDAMEWAGFNHDPAKGPFEVFARAVARTAMRRFVERIGLANLEAEKADEVSRDAAIDEEGIARYLALVREDVSRWLAWRRRVARRVIDRDERCQDLIGSVVVRVLELLRSARPTTAFRPYERTGVPALYRVRDEVLGKLRRKERLWLVAPPADTTHAHVPRPDEALMRRETETTHAAPVVDRLRPLLSRRIAPYMDAVWIEVQLDDRRWGLQERVSSRMGRSKSRVSEAMKRIREIAHAEGLEDLFALS